jgi:hypothetical protein
VLTVAWLVGALNPRGPYSILNVQGEQGSAKSTTQRILRACIDPSTVPLRTQPRDERDLLIAAQSGLVVGLDNVSTVQDWLSDALCRLVTGGGFSTRELFTDGEEVLIAAQRPAMANGISDFAQRPDFLDRSIVVVQPHVAEEQRRTERDIWGGFERDHPRILGALLDAVSVALRDRDTVSIGKLPRLADFAKWVAAAESSFGWEAGTFMRAYAENQAYGHITAQESSPIYDMVANLVSQHGRWTGTATTLLAELNRDADYDRRHTTGWPKSASALSSALRRIQPALRAAGIDLINEQRTAGVRRLTLSRR